MKKILNLFLIVFVLFNLNILSIGFNTFSYANQEATQSTNTSQTTPRTTTISGSTSSNNDVFSITNILLIILISIGVVLILLSIAILIRLKK